VENNTFPFLYLFICQYFNVFYSLKKFFLIFSSFVNGRSVESFRLQKSFDSIFTSRDLLCPFASFSLLIDPQRVDVNIHPTKKLVYFLCEDG